MHCHVCRMMNLRTAAHSEYVALLSGHVSESSTQAKWFLRALIWASGSFWSSGFSENKTSKARASRIGQPNLSRHQNPVGQPQDAHGSVSLRLSHPDNGGNKVSNAWFISLVLHIGLILTQTVGTLAFMFRPYRAC